VCSAGERRLNDNDTHKVSFLTQTTDRHTKELVSLKKTDFLRRCFREKAETMKSFTMAHFVKADQLPEMSPTLLDLVPSVVYDMFIAPHLSIVEQTCVRLAKSPCPQASIRPLWSCFPANITEKEADDMIKCDADKSEDDSWNEYEPDDDYDREYDPDFSAQWEEPHSDDEDDWFD
jgi:hypothetical protein